MLKKTLIAGLTTLALCSAHAARAADADNSGFGGNLFAHSASAGLQDPVAPSTTTADAEAAAAASIEPAAGGPDNVFTAVQSGNSGAATPTVPLSDTDAESLTTMTVFP